MEKGIIYGFGVLGKYSQRFHHLAALESWGQFGDFPNLVITFTREGFFAFSRG